MTTRKPRKSTARGRTPEEIEELLRRAVADGTLPPGQRLVHEELADRFGVSRIPLREALRTLAAEGLLKIVPGRGTFVTELDLAQIDELFELRRMVEPGFAAPVVLHSSPADIERLAAMAAEMDDIACIGADRWSRVNFAFHLGMYRLGRRPITYGVMSRLYHQLEPFSRFYVHVTQSYERVQCEHHAMVEAIRKRDPEELARQIVAHIEGGREGLSRAWSARSGELTTDPLAGPAFANERAGENG